MIAFVQRMEDGTNERNERRHKIDAKEVARSILTPQIKIPLETLEFQLQSVEEHLQIRAGQNRKARMFSSLRLHLLSNLISPPSCHALLQILCCAVSLPSPHISEVPFFAQNTNFLFLSQSLSSSLYFNVVMSTSPPTVYYGVPLNFLHRTSRPSPMWPSISIADFLTRCTPSYLRSPLPYLSSPSIPRRLSDI